MTATVILKNLSDAFWHGSEFVGPGFFAQTPAQQWERCKRLAADGMASIRIGHGAFREQVEFNSAMREPHEITSRVEPRKGYKLATFTFSRITS